MQLSAKREAAKHIRDHKIQDLEDNSFISYK